MFSEFVKAFDISLPCTMCINPTNKENLKEKHTKEKLTLFERADILAA